MKMDENGMLSVNKLCDVKDRTESQYSVIRCESDIKCEVMLSDNWISEYGCKQM